MRVSSWSVPCTRTRSRPATRSAFAFERPASMRSDSPRRSASPPTSCSMVSDRNSRAKASSTGRKSRFETGSVTDRGSNRDSGGGPKTNSSGLMSGTTASVDPSKGLSSVMFNSQELSGDGIRGEARANPHVAPNQGCGHGSADVPPATQARSVPAFVECGHDAQPRVAEHWSGTPARPDSRSPCHCRANLRSKRHARHLRPVPRFRGGQGHG